MVQSKGAFGPQICLPSVYTELETGMKVRIKALWSLCFVICFYSNIQEMRARHKDAFLKKHNLKLGFMSAFVKASAFALQEQPVVNAGEFVVAGLEAVLGGVCRNTDLLPHTESWGQHTETFLSYLWKHECLCPDIYWFTFLKWYHDDFLPTSWTESFFFPIHSLTAALPANISEPSSQGFSCQGGSSCSILLLPSYGPQDLGAWFPHLAYAPGWPLVSGRWTSVEGLGLGPFFMDLVLIFLPFCSSTSLKCWPNKQFSFLLRHFSVLWKVRGQYTFAILSSASVPKDLGTEALVLFMCVVL